MSATPEVAAPARPHRIVPGWVVGVAVLVTLALLVLGVWRLGGLEERTDLFRQVPPGTVVATGPYEFTFTEVTAQRQKDYTDQQVWQLTAIGTGRTTGDEAMAPSLSGGNELFVSADPKTREAHEVKAQLFGPGASYDTGDAFTPGLPPVEFRVQFSYGPTYQPGETLRFVVWDLEYRDPSLLGSEERLWRNAKTGTRMDLPVRVVPPRT